MTYTLKSLRAELASRDDVTVRLQGGTWIISQYSDADRCWHETPCHPCDDERRAIERALHIDCD